MIGMGYGLISGASAGAIAQCLATSALFGLVASRLYIGWCVAAICLPVVAAGLYDRKRQLPAAPFSSLARLILLAMGHGLSFHSPRKARAKLAPDSA
jgi:hypothetical protein